MRESTRISSFGKEIARRRYQQPSPFLKTVTCDRAHKRSYAPMSKICSESLVSQVEGQGLYAQVAEKVLLEYQIQELLSSSLAVGVFDLIWKTIGERYLWIPPQISFYVVNVRFCFEWIAWLGLSEIQQERISN
jgi:hypothetical protein